VQFFQQPADQAVDELGAVINVKVRERYLNPILYSICSTGFCMAALRAAAGPAGVMASDARQQFGILHGVSSVFYLADSLLGAALVLKLQASTTAQR